MRLVANSLIGSNQGFIYVDYAGGGVCKSQPQYGLARVEAVSYNSGINFQGGPFVLSLPFQLNLPTVPPPVITVSSINGIPINANPFSFPDATINTAQPVPVVINATNMPVAATVTMYLLSDTAANQSIPVTMTGTTQSSAATVSVTFPAGGTRGFVKANWNTLGTAVSAPVTGVAAPGKK